MFLGGSTSKTKDRRGPWVAGASRWRLLQVPLARAESRAYRHEELNRCVPAVLRGRTLKKYQGVRPDRRKGKRGSHSHGPATPSNGTLASGRTPGTRGLNSEWSSMDSEVFASGRELLAVAMWRDGSGGWSTGLTLGFPAAGLTCREACRSRTSPRLNLRDHKYVSSHTGRRRSERFELTLLGSKGTCWP